MDDVATRKARPLADGEVLELGRHRLRWIDTPHVPHGWECGYLFEEATRTLLCGDLFTRAARSTRPSPNRTSLGPARRCVRASTTSPNGPGTRPSLERLAALDPETLACMHGSAWRGDGKRLILAVGA